MSTYTEDQLEVDMLQDVQKCINKHIAKLHLMQHRQYITQELHDKCLVKFQRDLEEVTVKISKLKPYGELSTGNGSVRKTG
ncbi:MAG: hypothetical protein LPJ89_04245 [Hymenobacteraceae bacterium]|nr:hypothetical protein [Hymenobacteraceae bacterium]MDX5396271.1 hypothetical protein [Hymenobacteraceae bacterium]MDX5442975.1 hypothetical protein [Hymenobacteraceae bacterium]MDX5512332.1 hypothetical protein [Hymenobacteraceae bacterium]